MQALIYGVISAVIAVVLFTGTLIPTIKNTSTSGWTSSEVNLFSVTTIVAIAALIMLILGITGGV